MKKRVLLLIIAALFLFPPLQSQEESWYEEEAEKAINSENYEYAIELLKKASKDYPAADKYHIMLADLYYDKELYRLALKEYETANFKNPKQFDTLDRIQLCYSFLNEEQEAIKYLEELLKIFPVTEYPESLYCVHDLSWLYFKTFQMKKGEELILKTMEEAEETRESRTLMMSLGTLYSGMYEYEKSKEYYLKSIEDAIIDEDSNFAAIGYYNLSLLEYNFYHFHSAMEYTDLSLEQTDRSTGHLSRGELYQLQMNFTKSLDEYQMGLATEETPLTEINIARLYNSFGLLEPALRYSEKVRDSADLSWMANFGTDMSRYEMELHELFANTYEGLYRREALIPGENLWQELGSFFTGIWYWLNHYYHAQIQKSFSINIGKNHLKENNLLDAYWEFYEVNRNYKPVALKYLNLARQYETALAPESEPYYIQEEGRIRKSADLLRQSIAGFDPLWEQESIFNSLIFMLPLLKKGTVEYRETLSRAYGINPGGVFKSGYGVPLVLSLSGSNKKLEKQILAQLKRGGSETASPWEEGLYEKGFRYGLTILWSDKPQYSVKELRSGIIIKKGTIETGEGNQTLRCTRFIRTLLLDHLYTPITGEE